MREAIETGKTIEEAIEKACAALGLPREDVSIEVLETPQKKLFSSIPAKVKATAGEEDDFNFSMDSVMTEKKQQQKKRQEQICTQEKAVKKEEQQQAEELPVEGEKAAAAMAYISDVAKAMGITAFEIEAVKRGEITVIKIEGDTVGPLIGRRGETMDALSYLAGLVANRAGGEYEKISLDVSAYRAKREQDLMQLAKRVGGKVAKTGRSHTFEPMNPYERRIIHSAIGEIEGIKSESFGEGFGRRIVVSNIDSVKAKPNTYRDRNRSEKSNYRGKADKKLKQNTEHKQVPIAETISETPRPGKGPDEELLEKLATEGQYGKIEL